mgnify:CR=1 FL=1
MVSILVTLLIFALIGFCVHLVITYIPMPAPFSQIIIVACVVLMVLYLIALITGQNVPGIYLPR